MAHSPSAYTEDTVANTDDDDLTQASLSPGPSRQLHDGDDEHAGSTDLGSKVIDDVEDPTEPDLIELASEDVKIHCFNNTVFWNDENGDPRETEPLDLEIDIDNRANTAFLRLCGDIYLYSRKSFNKRPVYLYIRPETVESIRYQNDHHTRLLCFSLRSKPDLVIPKEPINAKPRSKALLEAIAAISTTTDFAVRLNSSSTTPSNLLQKVATVFSPRPTWNAQLGDLDGLYAGEGGQFASAGIAASTESEDSAGVDSEAQSPPPYRSAAKKRKLDIPNCESGPSSAQSDMPPINVMLREMEQRIMNSIQQLGEKLDDADPCRYSTEERDDVLAAVTQRCDDEFIDIKVESTDVLEEVKEEVERVLNQVDDDVEERIEMMQDELDERIKSIAQSTAEEAAEKYVKERLLNATWRMDGTMSLH
ncbi:hypothetical protein TgHK011_002162 [Trichoderma gracile]|nr:hypothetical protein TgHK011_002162 [Trichoderma gracile]